MIAVSIVSHGHGSLVTGLVQQLLQIPEVGQVIVTRNIPEPMDVGSDRRILLRDNESPKGFGANHNAAFNDCRSPYFCVLNPDVDLVGDPFPSLLSCLETTGAAVVAPFVVGTSGALEDSVRYFPTPLRLLGKAFGGFEGRYELSPGRPCSFVEWVAGMFMLFRASNFAAVNGFDESFFLYYEDVDICTRLWKSGRSVAVSNEARVMHAAQRRSHWDIRHARWHAASLIRYLWKHYGRLSKIRTAVPQ